MVSDRQTPPDLPTPGSASWLHDGVIAAKAGDVAGARQLFQRVVEAEPLNELAWLWLARLAAEPRDGVLNLECALTINPQNRIALKTLPLLQMHAGAAAAAAGDTTGARACFRSVAMKQPERDEAWLWLASLAESPPEAFEYIDNALRANPGNETAQQWRTAIEAELKSSPQNSTALARESPSKPRTRRSVLVVHDSPATCDEFKMALESEDITVISANSPREATEVLSRSAAPDLIFLSHRLGGNSSNDLLSEWRASTQTAGIPVVGLRDFTSFFGRLFGGTSRFDAVLHKPYTRERVHEAASRYLRKSEP